MRIFLETVSRRLGKTDEEIDLIVAGANWGAGRSGMRQDWLAAAQITCGGRGEKTEPPKGRYSVRNPS